MTYQDEVLGQLKAQRALLQQIHKQLEKLVMATSATSAPNLRRQLGEYRGFDWASIGAEVTAQDRNGASEVVWSGLEFKRRNGGGKYGNAIWFSRAGGKDGDKTRYVRLITFKDTDGAEPVNGKVVAAIAA